MLAMGAKVSDNIDYVPDAAICNAAGILSDSSVGWP